MITYTPYQTVQMIIKYTQNDILENYKDLSYDLEQQFSLLEFLVRTGQVKYVIKVSSAFYAVKGELDFKHELGGAEILCYMPGFYATFSKELDSKAKHQKLLDKDGNVITVVDTEGQKKEPWNSYDKEELGVGLDLGHVVADRVDLNDARLYGPDVDRFCNVQPNNVEATEPMVEGCKSLSSLLNILQAQVGASNPAEAVEIAILQSKQLEREIEYQEKSKAYSVMKNVFRQYENTGERPLNVSQAVRTFEQYEGLKSRQALAFGQVVHDIFH
ncbi:hypothetical protein [Photobacterium rosenbergii]|uniref:hypothetical protein n=1 Tax=Photobacterium rosenbergii TaxID=294936 RepID=UPI001C99F2D2|nr:hypothetical protein [Photobacterium rosenbergii]MBY5948777.1 hypothetical protein [Photobacterium rosenbergii]